MNLIAFHVHVIYIKSLSQNFISCHIQVHTNLVLDLDLFHLYSVFLLNVTVLVVCFKNSWEHALCWETGGLAKDFFW